MQAVTNEGAPNGNINGQPVRWILSLAEAHHSLYAADNAEGTKTLYWQDRTGKITHTLALDTASIADWPQ